MLFRSLHVMYVLEHSPEVYNLPVNPKVSAASIAWKDVIQPIGWILGGLTVLGLGINFIIARKAKMNRKQPVKKEEEK